MNPFFTGKHLAIDAPLFRAFVVSLGCLVMDAECFGAIEPHHEPPVGRCGSDVCCVPLCDHHHRLREKENMKFYFNRRIDLQDVHRRIWDGWLRYNEQGFAPLPMAQKKRRSRGANLCRPTKTVNVFT